MHRVLTVHNFYQHPGGEDQVFASEAALLERCGHRVERYTEDNRRIGSGIAAAAEAVWSQRTYRKLRSLGGAGTPGADREVESHPKLESHSKSSGSHSGSGSKSNSGEVLDGGPGPDVVHFHNTFPLISPSAYYAARARSTAGGRPAVVQTLHNYRLICPGATLFRDGTVCESCVKGQTLAPAVAHGCYRDSRPATAAVAAMLGIHRVAGTWRRMVDVYIALSEFARRKFIEGGLPAERIVVKPNFVSLDSLDVEGGAWTPTTPGNRSTEALGDYALFVGRLAEEKGVRTLAAAWNLLPGIPLVVAGDGPLKGIKWPAGVTALGQQTREQVLALMRGARVLIFPSLWYECAPMTIVEAFACGVPVIASDLGSMPEFVADGRTGRLFRAGSAEDLADKVRWAFAHPERIGEMGAGARREYEAKYTAERNYQMLMEIYERALEQARGERSAESQTELAVRS